MFGTNDIVAAMRAKYDPNAYALAFEVGDATGGRHSRWADAVVMSCWPSRGLSLTGFEFKASRTDWLKELRTPAKAESIAKYCEHWVLAVSDVAIVRDGELPETWGLMALDAKGQLVQHKPPAKLEPVPVTRLFLAALMRAMAKPTVVANSAELAKAKQRGREEAEKQDAAVRDVLNKKIVALTQTIADFEQAAGIKIDNRNTWRGLDAKKVGQTVRDVLDGKHEKDRDDIRHMRTIAADIVKNCDRFLSPEHHPPGAD